MAPLVGFLLRGARGVPLFQWPFALLQVLLLLSRSWATKRIFSALCTVILFTMWYILNERLLHTLTSHHTWIRAHLRRIADETSYNVCYPTIHNTWWRYWNQWELEYIVDIITWLAKAENFNTCKVSSNTPGAGLTLTNNITRPCPAQWPLPTKKFWNSWVNLLSLNGTIRRSPFLQRREQTRWM